MGRIRNSPTFAQRKLQRSLRIGLKRGERPTKFEAEKIREGARPEAVAAQRAIKRLMKGDKQGFKERFKSLNEIKGWNIFRTWENDYELFFGNKFMGKLESMAQERKGRLKILEEGAGDCIAIEELAESLRKKGIKVEATAISLDGRRYPEKVRLVRLPIETANIGRQDAIIGVYGALHYIESKAFEVKTTGKPRQLSKQVLLKYCYSLNKGGIAAIGLIFIGKFQKIKQDLEKRGFKADLQNHYGPFSTGLPSHLLYIERVR